MAGLYLFLLRFSIWFLESAEGFFALPHKSESFLNVSSANGGKSQKKNDQAFCKYHRKKNVIFERLNINIARILFRKLCLKRQNF